MQLDHLHRLLSAVWQTSMFYGRGLQPTRMLGSAPQGFGSSSCQFELGKEFGILILPHF